MLAQRRGRRRSFHSLCLRAAPPPPMIPQTRAPSPGCPTSVRPTMSGAHTRRSLPPPQFCTPAAESDASCSLLVGRSAPLKNSAHTLINATPVCRIGCIPKLETMVESKVCLRACGGGEGGREGAPQCRQLVEHRRSPPPPPPPPHRPPPTGGGARPLPAHLPVHPVLGGPPCR